LNRQYSILWRDRTAGNEARRARQSVLATAVIAVILSAAKNLARTDTFTKILRCAQNDRLARISGRARSLHAPRAPLEPRRAIL
jgi:hypothetical protein